MHKFAGITQTMDIIKLPPSFRGILRVIEFHTDYSFENMLPVSDFSTKFMVSSPLTYFLPHRLKDKYHEYPCISTNIHVNFRIFS